jgi:hypothetical protein
VRPCLRVLQQEAHIVLGALDGGADRLGLFIARKPEEVLRAAEAS